MRPITVAITDINRKKRRKLEQFLQNDKQRLNVLSDKISNRNERSCDRRLKPRDSVTFIEDSIARTKRLKPRVLLVGTQMFPDSVYNFLPELRRECPDTLIIILTNDTTEENKILDGLANGARGFLNYGANLISFSKAICAVQQGEAWVPRKMLKRIMERILYANYHFSIGDELDSSC